MRRREAGNRLPIETAKVHRVEADVVRFESERLSSGLYRHNSTKVIFELAKQREDGRWRAG